jgi:hypothetical protein
MVTVEMNPGFEASKRTDGHVQDEDVDRFRAVKGR